MDNIQITHLLHLQEASNLEQLVVFVGAGVSANSDVPNWESLIKSFKDELGGNIGVETDYLKVAQIYKNTRDKKDYFEKIRKVLRDGNVAYNPIHNAVLQLNPAHIITTNYDNLIEQAILANYKQYDIIRKDADLPYYRYPNKVIKMHGDFSADNIVLAEEDYYNYGRNFPLIRSFVTSLFTTNVVLFIGFSFDDLNLKIILNEIKTILDENMQRVYLLTDEHVDKEMLEYYEKKGINVVSITNPDEFLNKYSIDVDQIDLNKLKSIKGKNLYKQIKIIQHIKNVYSEDVLSDILVKLKKVQGELNVIGDGLRYLFPEKSYKSWYYRFNALNLDSSYFKKLTDDLKTYSGKRRFVQSFPKEDRLILLQHAFVNQVYAIDGMTIIDESNFNKIRNSLDGDFCVDYFYNLNFKKLYETMKDMRSQGMSFGIKDIYLPYVLCRLGKYYEAYIKYKELLPQFWDKKLYILYFISVYNLNNIRYSIKHEAWDREDIDGDSIVKEIEAFDLDTILLKLPIDKYIKQTFKDLLTLKFFSKNLNESNSLFDEIHKQKIDADNGGFSSNYNIYYLIDNFYRVYRYCVSNCLEFRNSYFYSLAKLTVSGILVSHITKENQYDKIFRVTKLYSLEWQHIFIMLFFIDTKELSDLFKQYDVKSITLNDDAIFYLKELTNNLYWSLHEHDRFKKPTYNVGVISDVLGNMVFVIGHSSNDYHNESAEKLYKTIHDLWCNEMVLTVGKHLNMMVEKCKPSNEVAIDILDDMIKVGRYDSLGLAQTITNQLQQEGVVFDRVNDVEVLFEGFDGQLGMIMYNILPSSIKMEYLKYVQNNSKRLIIYLVILKQLNFGIDNVNAFEKLLKQPRFIKEFEEEEITGACWYLADFRKNALYSNAHAMIDDFGKNHEQYKFYLDPIRYQDVDKIETTWLLRVEESMLKELIKNDIIKEKVKTSVLSGKLDERKVNMLIKIL